MNINILQINKEHPYYEQERKLRNEVLLRPIGVPDFAWEMKDDIAWHFVAEQKDKVVACVLLAPLNKSETKAQLLQMAVSESVQGQGVGKLLVKELLNFASEHHIKEISCHARDTVVKFYEKLGFEVYDEPFEEVGIKHRHMSIFISN